MLNFRPGADPPSFDTVAARQVAFHLARTQLPDFEDGFIKILEKQISRSMDDGANGTGITEAWKKLFDPVLAEMLGYLNRHARLSTLSQVSHASRSLRLNGNRGCSLSS